ncbi:MAG: FAD-dependent monooxygenase [Myxococcota bacterium]
MIGIIGAGPGGLVAAVALRRAGFEVEVLERTPEAREVGAGLTLQVNAMRMLDATGLGEAVEAEGWVLGGLQLTRPDGRVLVAMPSNRERPGVAIHRGALSRVLIDALPAGTVRYGKAVTAVTPDGTVTFADGSNQSYDLVVGADGIHSAVRTALFGEQRLRDSGTICWRGLARLESEAPLTERWGLGLRFGTVPVAKKLVYWFACSKSPRLRHGAGIAELRDGFSDFEPEVDAVLAATPRALQHDLYDLAPLRQWTKGRVTLLGDAAHAMTPNLGQGAGQAIEDGVVLAHALATHGMDQGLVAYEAVRKPRARSFVQRSWWTGQVAQWSNPVACWARNQLLAWTPSFLVQRQMKDDYGVSVPQL